MCCCRFVGFGSFLAGPILMLYRLKSLCIRLLSILSWVRLVGVLDVVAGYGF
jgi:hypothetical protein